MIIRRIRTLSFVFLVFVILPSIKSQTNAPTSSAHNCEPGMFSCTKDASCIPMDWVGDNELDCSDGSDETGANLPVSSKSSKLKQKVICWMLFLLFKLQIIGSKWFRARTYLQSRRCLKNLKLKSIKTNHHKPMKSPFHAIWSINKSSTIVLKIWKLGLKNCLNSTSTISHF